jgi:hypothetical protein
MVFECYIYSFNRTGTRLYSKQEIFGNKLCSY